jgi:beta-N-acetylhexosaminidase
MTKRRTSVHPPKLGVGQLLIVGFDGTEMNPRLRALLTQLQPAGVILFARNIKSAQQTWQLLHDCRNCVAVPLFTCIDLEGGTVDRLRGVLGPAPAAAEVFGARDARLFRRHGEILGKNARSLGFNVDFAPVLDLAFDASRTVMSTRAVSADPGEATFYAHEFLAGLVAARVLGCGKHFPGLGEGKLDSHLELPVMEKPLQKLWEEDLVPYRSLRRQLPMVMVSHASYPQITKKSVPASLSETWITAILRKRIGFRNLIVSDDLEMGGVLSAAPVDQAALKFVRAGGDLCLVCHQEEHVRAAYQTLAKEAECDSKFAKRVAESLLRVATFKRKWAKHMRREKAPSEAAVQKLSRELWEFGEQVRLAPLARADDRKPKDQSRAVQRNKDRKRIKT